MIKNGIKNGKYTQFSNENQPSSIAKSIGWKRKRYAQEFMDKVMEYQNLTLEEFETIEKSIKDNKDKHTIRDIMAFKYVSGSMNSNKLLIDWVDRHVSRAKFEGNLEDKEDAITKVVVEIVDSNVEQSV